MHRLLLLVLLALAAAPAGAAEKVHRSVELPVLLRYVPPGETIAADDVGMVEVPAARLVQAVVAEPADLIGKTPRRAVRPGQPVRAADVQLPVVIQKGELVTVVVETGSMRLTAQARASEDGAQGQAIRITNTRSGKVLDATVAGPGIVRIEAAP
jgi:flagella basal body P-ring formation protein FlgA